MSNSAKGFSSCLNGDHLNVHPPCKGSCCAAYTHSATEVKLSRRDKVGSVLFCLPTVEITDPWILEEKTHHTGSDQRAVLTKCLPACNKCLCEKHLKKKENMEILFPWFTLLMSQDQQFRGFLGALGPLCTHPSNGPLHTDETLSHTHNMTGVSMSCWLSDKQHTAALQGKAKEVPQLVPAACHWC